MRVHSTENVEEAKKKFSFAIPIFLKPLSSSRRHFGFIPRSLKDFHAGREASSNLRLVREHLLKGGQGGTQPKFRRQLPGIFPHLFHQRRCL